MNITLTPLQVAVLQVAFARLECARDFISPSGNETAITQLEAGLSELKTQLPEVFKGA